MGTKKFAVRLEKLNTPLAFSRIGVDYNGALNEGYSIQKIVDYFSTRDKSGKISIARLAGHTDAEIFSALVAAERGLPRIDFNSLSYNFDAALRAGIAPKEIIKSIEEKGHSGSISNARRAGWGDAEIFSALVSTY